MTSFAPDIFKEVKVKKKDSRTRLERIESKLLGIASAHYADFEDPFDPNYKSASQKSKIEKPYYSVRDNTRQNTLQDSIRSSKSKAEILYDQMAQHDNTWGKLE